MSDKLPFHQRIRIGWRDRQEMYEVLGVMTGPQGGIALNTALKDMEIEFRESKHPLYPLIKELNHRMRGGRSTSSKSTSLFMGDCLQGLVPANEAMMIRAAESRGSVSQGLLHASEYVGAIKELVSIIRQSMFLIVIYIVAILGLYAFFSYSILPQLSDTIPRHKWPKYAQNFGWVADHLYIIVPAVIGFVLVAVFISRYLMANMTGNTRTFLDKHIWPFTTQRLLNASALLAGLSGFFSAGVPFSSAISALKKSSDRYMQSKHHIIQGELQEGKNDHNALLATELIPRKFAWIVSCHGRTSGFGVKLGDISKQFISHAIQKAKQTASVLFFAGLFMVGMNLLWVIISFYGIVQQIK